MQTVWHHQRELMYFVLLGGIMICQIVITVKSLLNNLASLFLIEKGVISYLILERGLNEKTKTNY